MSGKAAQAALVVVAVLSTVSVSAQEWANKMFPTTSHDFGVVARGEDAQYAFVLENLYMENVHVADVHASCSCTTPEIKTPTLKTYEKGMILARYNTSAFVGSRGATLTVTIDKPYFAQVQLHVRGFIRGDVMLTPGMADFGELDEGSVIEKAVLVQHTGSEGRQIVAAQCTSPHLSATATEVSRTGGQATYRVSVRLDGHVPSGYFADRVVLVTNDADNRQVIVPVAGTVRSQISLSPSPLLMGMVEPGQKVTKQLVVRGQQPFRINEVKCEGPGFTVAAVDGASEKKVHLVSVTFEAGRGPSSVNGLVHVDTTIGKPLPASVCATIVERSH